MNIKQKEETLKAQIKVKIKQDKHLNNSKSEFNSILNLFELLFLQISFIYYTTCLLYTSDAADDMQCVDLGGRRIIKKKKQKEGCQARLDTQPQSINYTSANKTSTLQRI
eukprot:TRINITY_DN4625_c0_g1_i1.p2 TRINITY_DN4625_c0_g1~~TRINITY_DN4625_c0_g1_i1.p2  ORF type:complete len:110 (+),score=19.07 TRINITY_DN4625_c0_g1_i1:158-487(+)